MASANADANRPGLPPPLTRSDAWLLAAIADGYHDGRPVTLSEFVDGADWLNRAIPTFDEVSFGLPRLVAAGYVTIESDDVEGLAFRATPRGMDLRASVKAKSLGGVLLGMDEAAGTAPYPEPEREDHSLGRLPGLTREELDAAVAAHREDIDRLSKPFIDAAQAMIKRQNRE